MTQPVKTVHPSNNPTTHRSLGAEVTSDEARQMYLDQLKKTNPSPKVQAVIDTLESTATEPKRPKVGRLRRRPGAR